MTTAEQRRWYVVYSKPHKEDLAQFHLRLKGIHVFAPRLLLPRYARKRKQIVPLFPNYLFVRLHISDDCYDEYHHVRWTPGVKRFVSFNGTHTPLDDDIMALLMQQADADGIITARSSLTSGQEVRITGGPFEGLVGIIQNPPNAKGRVKVFLELLRRGPVKVDVPVQFVEGRWVV
jgi:transcriptional antiterminator RfaH